MSQTGGDRVGDEQSAASAASDTPGPGPLTIEVDGASHIVQPDGAAVTVGREPPADIVVPRPGVSRVHVHVRHDGAHWSLTDAGSRNGIYRDGLRVEHVIVDGSLTLHIGDANGIVLHAIPHVREVDPTQLAEPADAAVGIAGAAVAARREELGLSRVTLAADVLTPDEMARFEGGRHWPDPHALATLEERLTWPAGAIAGIRDGAPVPEDEFTEVLTPTVQVSVAVDAADIAVRAIRARAELLPGSHEPDFTGAITPMLAELRRLDRTITAAARNAPGRLEVIVALAEIRRLSADLTARAACSPQASLGQRVGAVRRRGGLTAAEVAAAAGVSLDDVEAVEAEDRPADTAAEALERFVAVVGPAVSPAQ
jgi:DNA-binding transcriptional regulator YiaG